MDLDKICPYGMIEWENRKNGKVSAEYFEGSYPQIRCNTRGDICSFKDFQDCILWEKKEKE